VADAPPPGASLSCSVRFQISSLKSRFVPTIFQFLVSLFQFRWLAFSYLASPLTEADSPSGGEATNPS
jgi:hypothetical protein